MSANVESMAWNNVVRFENGKPWHGEGVCVDDEQALFDVKLFGEKAGINWDVFKEPLVTLSRAKAAVKYAKGEIDTPFEAEPDTDAYAIRRKTDFSILGIVGPKYRPLQNVDALKWFEPWLDNGLLALNTAGSLENGKKVWVLAQVVKDTIMDVTGKDTVAKFVMLSNSHDGTAAVRVGLSPIRIVCQNTLTMAHRSSESKLMRIRHSSQMERNLEAMRDAIDLVNNDFETTAEQYRWLSTRHVHQKDLRKYVRVLIQGEKDAEQPFDDVSTRTQNIIKKIEGYMDMPNQKISSGSWWAAYNSENEYLNYESGRNVNTRLSSLWFGQSASLNKEALDLALKMAA